MKKLQVFKIIMLSFRLTIRNVNTIECGQGLKIKGSFRLTIRNVNSYLQLILYS